MIQRRSCLTLATSQFPVSGNLRSNGGYIRRHIEKAGNGGAHAILFPESALTGYPGTDRASLDDLDWHELRTQTERVMTCAREHQVWVLVGSAHFLSSSRKPTNCLYVIDSRGKIRTRYDKRMLYKQELEFYSPGNESTPFRIGTVRCGALICFDSCFPDLYQELERARVRVLFHAFYNAGRDKAGRLDPVIPSQVRARAHDHSYAIVASNSCRRHSAMASCVALPDGRFTSLRRHAPGVLLETIPAEDSFWSYRRDRSPAIRGAIRASSRKHGHGRLTNRRLTDRRTLP